MVLAEKPHEVNEHRGVWAAGPGDLSDPPLLKRVSNKMCLALISGIDMTTRWRYLRLGEIVAAGFNSIDEVENNVATPCKYRKLSDSRGMAAWCCGNGVHHV